MTDTEPTQDESDTPSFAALESERLSLRDTLNERDDVVGHSTTTLCGRIEGIIDVKASATDNLQARKDVLEEALNITITNIGSPTNPRPLGSPFFGTTRKPYRSEVNRYEFIADTARKPTRSRVGGSA
jgi:hypothetical protein